MSRRRKDLVFEESLFNNQEDFYNLRERLIDLAIGRMKFKGLPEYIFKPFIYRQCLFYRELLFAYDEDLDRYFLYPYINAGGRLDEYNIPIERRITLQNNGYTRVFTKENSVILRTSNSGTPIIPTIEEYARKLYIISRTIDVNVNAQKTPVIILCPEEQRLTYENLLKQYTGNVPFIWGDSDVMQGLDNNVKVLNLNAPYVADKLQMLKSNIWNEYLTFLGISNITINKKERLITDEVQRAMGGVIVQRNNFVAAIKDSIEEINKKFNMNIEFLFGEEVDEKLTGPDDSERLLIEERSNINV